MGRSASTGTMPSRARVCDACCSSCASAGRNTFTYASVTAATNPGADVISDHGTNSGREAYRRPGTGPGV